jgi:hypothetical protein
MNLYPWVVLVHVTGVLLFFIAHGASAFVGVRLRAEREPARVVALLDLSRWSLGPAAGISLLVGLVAGIAAGFIGGWWGHLWIWLSLGTFLAVGGLMTPMAAMKLSAMRSAAGIRIQPPFGFTKEVDAPVADPAELQRLLDAWNPWPVTVLGFAGFTLILGLMLLKPL